MHFIINGWVFECPSPDEVHSSFDSSDAGGSCPIDAPKGCIPGPTFSPNGLLLSITPPLPIHGYACRPSLLPASRSTSSLYLISGDCFAENLLKMIDRIWFKWQHKHALNKRAFEGGSVQMLDNATVFSEYPNGGAPWLTVRPLLPFRNRSDSHYCLLLLLVGSNSKFDSEIPTDGLSEAFIIGDFISTTEGPLCYVYE